MADGYDVFVSLPGADREPVRELVRALGEAGLTVFLDEQDIDHFTGITAEIEAALRNSTALLAYYSKAFPTRPACQYELTAAFLAGQVEGDPARRLMVVNPESTVDHLQPVELADARFAELPAPRDKAALTRLVALVKARVRTLTGRIGGVPFHRRPRWYGLRVRGPYGFVGRYRELWALHSALSEGAFGLTQVALGGQAAIVTGLPGVGKSALATAYGWRFGAAHLGGVYWVSLAGARASDVRTRFAEALSTLVGPDGWSAAGVTPDQVPAVFAEYLANREHPGLVVVDDVPPDLDPQTLAALVLGGGTHVRTVLVTQRAPYDSPVKRVEVGPMSEHDALLLLRTHRSPDSPDETEALERIVARLDGHPYALHLAGQHVRGRQDLLSYARYADALHAGQGALPPTGALFRAALSTVDETQRLLLQVFLVCAPTDVPATFLAEVASAFTDADVGAALVGLGDRLLATRTGATWRLHALVRDAVRTHLSPSRPQADLARVAAAFARTPGTVRHAGVLAQRPDLPAATVEALLEFCVAHHEARGEAVLAAPFRRRLAERRPGDAAGWVASARTHHAAGDHEAALAHAERARALSDDSADGVTAEALDALGRFEEADAWWARAPRTEVAWLRALRVRGRTARAKQEAEKFLSAYADTSAPFSPEVEGVRLELARIQLMTDDQRGARDNAALVLRRYEEHGLAQHSRALEARQVFAEAQLTLPLLELNPDPRSWREAEVSLRELAERLRRTHGRRNLSTLTATVGHAHALVALGRPDVARDRLTTTLPDIVDRCGTHHPLHHRATFLLGQTHGQRRQWPEATRCHRAAYEGLRDLVGPTHPDTLAAQLELGVGLKHLGEDAAARRMFADVLDAVPHTVGRKTDLFGRALTARLLTVLPSPVWRLLAGPRRESR